MLPIEWIRDNIQNGYSDKLKDLSYYNKFLEETDSQASFASYLRKVRKEISKTKKENKAGETIEPGTIVSKQKTDKEMIIVVANVEEITNKEELAAYSKEDLSKWNIKRQTLNKWGKDHHQVKISLEPKTDFTPSIEDYLKGLYDSLGYKPKPFNHYEHLELQGNLAVLFLTDIHFGLLSRIEDTGENYNLDIAEETIKKTVKDLMTKTVRLNKIEKILFPIGSDFFNVDNHLNQTNKGTLQDETDLWWYTFKRGLEMLKDVINYLKKYASIDILMVPGNHDRIRTLYLGVALEQYYHNDDLVYIDNRVKTIKYYNWGKCLLGISHGDFEDKKNIPLMMSRDPEANKYWSHCKYIEYLTGHGHRTKAKEHEIIDEEQGIITRMFSALSARSSWIASKGYRSIRKGVLGVYNAEHGRIAEINSTII